MHYSSKIDSNITLIRPIYTSFIVSIVIGIGVISYGPSSFFPLLALSIFIINIFCSFEGKKSNLFALLLLIVLYLLMVATNNNNGLNGDYRAYNGLYAHFLNGGTISNITGYSTDYGYMLLMLYVSKLGISYNFFITILALISIILIKSTLSKITDNYNLVLVCYALSPFIYDVYQFRFFFAYSIVLFGLQYIIFEKKISFLKFTAMVLIASFFHKTALFFLIYLLLKMKIKSILKFSIVASVFITVGSFITKKNIIDFIFPLISYSKFESYTSGNIHYELNPLVQLAVIAMNLVLVFVVRSIYKKDPSYTNKWILWLNFLNLLILPFFLVSLDFERFTRPLMFINFALIAGNSKVFAKSKRIFVLLSLFLIFSAWLYLRFGILQNVLENNFIFEQLVNLTN